MIRSLRLLFVVLFAAAAIKVVSQDTSGITGSRDSSFTRVGEFERMLRDYPTIRLVEEPDKSNLISRDVVYRVVDRLQLAGDIYIRVLTNVLHCGYPY